MFDMDRWLKRLWMVNGVLLLALLILGTGALLVSWLSGAFSRNNAVIAADTTRGAPAKPRAVRFSPPREIWGTKTRVVIVRYGKGQQGAGFGSGSDMSSREYYSLDGDRGSAGPVVNLIFLSGTEPGHVLLDKPAYVDWFDSPTAKSDSLQRWIAYHIAFDDTNKDGRLDSDDRVDLYLSDLDGTHLRRVLPPGMRLLHQDPVGDGRHLIVTALQVPNDWRGSDDELRERAFLYDVQTGATTPHVGLDSLVQRAARVLGRP
jgi:hypothetical protein